jgi:hypothetical protein
MISFLLRHNKQLNLKNEKQKDYRNVVIIQILIISVVFTFKEVLLMVGMPYTKEIWETVFLLLGGLYLLMLWDMLKNFTQNEKVIRVCLALIIVGLALASVFVNPFFSFFEPGISRKMIFLIHISLFYVEVTLIYFSVVDIFRSDSISGQKLWGAACVYFMIGLAFGSLYDIINVLKPGCMGVELEMGLVTYFETIYYSFDILAGGLSGSYPDAIKLIKNLGLLQSIWSNMFIVLIVGKLLAQPEVPKENESEEVKIKINN